MLSGNDGFHKCVAKTPTWQDGRETNVRVRLTPAKYCIVPSTFQPDMEGDFILRVHIERYSNEHNAAAVGEDGERSTVIGEPPARPVRSIAAIE